MIVRKVGGLWIVQAKTSNQIVFSHKSKMACYEWMFKDVHYA